ncbi:hypothetical protein EV580_3149 [Mycobacterium sp. BK086]|uniref:hypothetical protein n=1 Tax=Mycobacterium sp. BK086 TaxID=2512165 RepID=UPI00105E83D8|nr:hypothetical protein [Mycobacterium sp. BK086]TDO15009.1 hypothetical protein EV580_3149 [Mycobacterium sp. BK086]
MTAAWVAPRHPIISAATMPPSGALVGSAVLLRNLIDTVIPEWDALEATADRAVKLALDLRAEAESVLAWPSTPSDVTDEWLDNEVSRRLGKSDHEVRIQVLRELEFGARTEIIELVDERAENLITELASRLSTLLLHLTTYVEQLGADVNTAAEAIEAGTTDAWRSINASAQAYNEIREVQLVLYRRQEFDRRRCGDDNVVKDAEARLFFHRRLELVAPDWRSSQPTYPWPNDPAERLVWLIRHDSGMWCPTTAQINRLLAEGPEPAPATTGTGRNTVSRKVNPRGRYRDVDDSGHRLGVPVQAAPSPLPAPPTPTFAGSVTTHSSRWDTPASDLENGSDADE